MELIDLAGRERANPQAAPDGEGQAASVRAIAEPAEAQSGGASPLFGLERVAPDHADDFLAAAEQGNVRCWFAFFPRLHFYGGLKNHDLLWERHNGSILVYQARRKKGEVRLHLYLPPFPFDAAALRHAQERMQDFNGGPGGRIVFVEEAEALKVARAGFEISFSESQYIYDRETVMAREGSAFSTLRRKLASAARDGIDVRPYAASDRAACVALTENWRERLVAAGITPTSYRHTIACLEGADRFASSRLAGSVAEIDGAVAGFAFGGPITSRTGALYITINDTEAPAVAYLLRTELMAAMPSLTLFNDSSDTKRAGLRDLKQRFRPVAMLDIYSARSR